MKEQTPKWKKTFEVSESLIQIVQKLPMNQCQLQQVWLTFFATHSSPGSDDTLVTKLRRCLQKRRSDWCPPAWACHLLQLVLLQPLPKRQKNIGTAGDFLHHPRVRLSSLRFCLLFFGTFSTNIPSQDKNEALGQ